MKNPSSPNAKRRKFLVVSSALAILIFFLVWHFAGSSDSSDSPLVSNSVKPSPTLRQTITPTPKPTPTPTPSPSDKSGGGDTNIYDNPDQQNTDGYVLNTSTKKFHRPSCGYVSRIKPSNYATAESRSSATLGGYDPCKKCNP